MLTVFFDQEGVVHHEYAPQGCTINKEYYLEVIKRLRDAVRRKRPHLWKSGNWLLQHDNALAHSSHLIQEFLTKHSIVQLHQLLYSPDIAPCDFWLFPKLKHPLKGKRFDDVEEIKRNKEAVGYHKKRLPGLLSQVGAPLAEGHCFGRKLL